jgi:UDP-2-acetamido-3-amino-2,3-dideoxy-glucuronate N-acetyltransferase
MVIAANVVLGTNVWICHSDLVNLYGCTIGDDVVIGPFVEVQAGCSVGPRCKIASHSFLCGGVILEEEVMIAHGVMFTNDLYPQILCPDIEADIPSDWRLVATRVCRGAVIGSNATIIAGVTIGASAVIAAGSVVICDVPANATVVGSPARVVCPQSLMERAPALENLP